MLVAFSPRRLIMSAAPTRMRPRDGAPGLVTADWEQLPEALPEKHLKPVFVRADG